MRSWLTLWSLVLLLSTPATAFAKLVFYEPAPLPKQLHPFLLASSSQGLHLSALITERLARQDAANNMLVLGMFKEVKLRGARVAELTLKEKLRWSDGSPLTANDIATSFARLMQMANGQEDPPIAARVLARAVFLIERIDAEAPDQVVFHFRQPVLPHELPTVVAMLPIVPAKQNDKELSSPGAVTFGPYYVAKMDKDSISLKANPHYYLGRPKIGEIEVQTADAKDLDAVLVNEGKTQMAAQVPAEMLDTLRKRPDLVMRPANTRRMLYLGFNLRAGSCFADLPDLRLAVASLIDRQGLQDASPDGGESRPMLTGPYSPDSAYVDPEIEAPAFSVPIAAQRLAQLGFRRVGETYRDSQGRPLKVRLLVSTAVPAHEALGRVIKEQLEREGVGLEISRVDPGEFLNTALYRPGEYDMTLHQWLFDEGQDIFEIFHSKGLYNYIGYANTSVDERLSLDRHATMSQSRVLYRREIHRLLSRELPVLFLWENHDVTVFRSDLEHVPPLDPYFIFRDVHLWTSPEEGGDGQAEASTKSP